MQPWCSEDGIVWCFGSDDGELDGTGYTTCVYWKTNCSDHLLRGLVEASERARGRLHISQIHSHFVQCVAKDEIDRAAGVDKDFCD